jgi:uncharacterized protein involved in exopolysaccharide biosynthesis
MDIYSFIGLLARKIRLLAGVPVIAGSLLFILTSNQTKEYATKATIFTAITSSSSLENLDNNRVDFFATKTAYNNLISIINSRNVIEETSLRLLSKHLVYENSNETELSKDSHEKLFSIIPKDILKLVVKHDEEQTFKNLSDFMKQDRQNFLYGLINLDHPHYSYRAISRIKTTQIGASDIIELSYSSNDPAVAYQTLDVLIEVFLKRYSDLKQNQTNAVVEYFEKQLDKSSVELDNAEDRLLDFNKSNNIINYYEQTKHISSQQEKIEVKLQDILMEYQAAEAVLSKLETETQSRFNINLRNKEILELRKSLILVNKRIAELEMEEYGNSEKSNQLNETQQLKIRLEHSLRSKMDSLYIFQRNSDGLAISTLLEDWLQTVIEYESSKARLLAMKSKSIEFQKLYNQYAPLGAILKRIEREIEVKEKAYLEILHHLGLAKLKQQNEEMMSNMKILDKPMLPIDPLPTKRKIMIIAITFFSLILTILGLFIFELLDNTVKTVKRYIEKSDLNVAGAIAFNKGFSAGLSHELIKSGSRPIIDTILKHKQFYSQKNTLVVQVFSLWRDEGKTYLIENLKKQMQHLGFSTKTISLKNQETEDKVAITPQISISEQFKHQNYIDLVSEKTDFNDVDILFIEVPAISKTIYNPYLINSASMSFLITDACRTWSEADNFILNKLKETIQHNFYGVLNKVFTYHFEEVSGEIPKQRSEIRKYIKHRIIKRLA